MEVASGSAIILPMVKDLFLIGFVVVEGVIIGPKTGKLRPVKPVWPPKKGTRTPAVAIPLSKQQLTELPKIARTLALACVVDQVNLNHPPWGLLVFDDGLRIIWYNGGRGITITLI